MDLEADFVEYMEKTFPKAFALLKDIAESTAARTVRIETTVARDVAQVWHCWTTPDDVMQWNHASDDWYTPLAKNDLRTGGSFTYRMAARDGSASFDFGGTFDDVRRHELIASTLGDGRKVRVEFKSEGNSTKVIESFEVETTHPVSVQRQGWQAILDNFKRHAESY